MNWRKIFRFRKSVSIVAVVISLTSATNSLANNKVDSIKNRESIVGERTSVPVHLRKLRDMRKKFYKEENLSGFDTTLLAQEAKRVKRILEVERQEVYKGSSLGLVANVTVRKISLFMVNNFPQFFGYLYSALRAANVKVLSNTYVNIMILVSLAVIVGVFFLLLIAFFIIGHPLIQVVLRSIIFSIMAGLLSATIFYVYPFMKIRDRRRKTTTNLPFAINHMSAVATSGVPPATMFELIAESGEYEEVGIEVKKVVDFTNIFGYDLLTAIRAVSATTPSVPFKKFLDGLVSAIETGGDLVAYLQEQAAEAELTYRLERQRYNETVSTYSDIYTGVLIAAPLFFIAAMALVNMLGGSIGGIGVGAGDDASAPSPTNGVARAQSVHLFVAVRRILLHVLLHTDADAAIGVQVPPPPQSASPDPS